MKKEDLFRKAVIGVTTLAFATGLFAYMLAGTSSRYMKDDYCYAVTLDRRGFLDGQAYSYFNAVDFSGNRFSLTLGMGLSELAGRWTVPVLPAVMIALWLLGLYALARQLSSLAGNAFGRLESVLAVAALALFSITLAPNWIQVIYWRPGMFPYFAPVVFGCWLALAVLHFRPGRWTLPYLLLVFLLALLVGGFSEVGDAVEVTALFLALGISLASGDKRKWLPAVLAALTGALLALALLALSPVTALRFNNLYGNHPSLLSALLDSARNVIAFYLAIAYRSTLLYASAFLFFCLLALLAETGAPRPARAARSILARAALGLAFAFVLTWAAVLPSFYIESGAPGERVLVIPAFIAVLLAGWLGTLLGEWLASRLEPSGEKPWGLVALAFAVAFGGGLWLAALPERFEIPDYPALRTFVQANGLYGALIVLASLCLAVAMVWRLRVRPLLFALLALYLCQPLLVSAHVYAQLPALRERAFLWDERDAQIRALRSQGETDITVRALDSLAGISELSAKPGNWVNTCAAKYYRVRSISAIPPVLNTLKP